MNGQELLEALAAKEHESWANWMTYLFSQCFQQADGSLVIPQHKVIYWQQQVRTPYSALPDAVKELDREEVRKILPIIGLYLLKGQKP